MIRDVIFESVQSCVILKRICELLCNQYRGGGGGSYDSE